MEAVFWGQLCDRVRKCQVWVHVIPMVTKIGCGKLWAVRSEVRQLMTVWVTVALVVHYRTSWMQVAQTDVMRSCGRGLVQVGEAAVLGDWRSCRLVETGETRMMVQGGVVVMKEVRKTGIRMQRGGVLWRRVQGEGVWVWVNAGAGTGAWI